MNTKTKTIAPKIPWKKIYKEYLDNSSCGLFICRRSPTFKELWETKDGNEKIRQKAKSFLKKRNESKYRLSSSQDKSENIVLFVRNQDWKAQLSLEEMIEFRHEFIKYCATPKPKSLKEQTQEFNKMMSA